MIVTSTGEKIAPADLELAITADPLFDMAYVVRDNRLFIACIVVLNPAPRTQLAASLQLDPRRRRVCSRAPHVLTLLAWTTENTLMTPPLKIKRHNLAAHFSAQI